MKNYLIPVTILALLLVRPAFAHYLQPLTPQEAATRQEFNLLRQAGLNAGAAHDYADAVIDLRRAAALDSGYSPVWAELGLMLDYQSKRKEAFSIYQKAFGSPVGTTFGTNSFQLIEALTRYGAMCEDRGLHESGVQCFNLARQWADSGYIAPLDGALEPKATSPSVVRMMLYIVRGVVLEQAYEFGPDRSADALAAFEAAVRLAPNDPRSEFFLAYGLRHARRFAEAEDVLKKVSRLDTSGSLKKATAESLENVRDKSTY